MDCPVLVHPAGKSAQGEADMTDDGAVSKWLGAAGVCVNSKESLLMVKQGTPKGEKTGESFAECCIREVEEETGYKARIIRPLFVKRNTIAEVHYFEVEIYGGKLVIQDPDYLVYEVAWKSRDDWETLTEFIGKH